MNRKVLSPSKSPEIFIILVFSYFFEFKKITTHHQNADWHKVKLLNLAINIYTSFYYLGEKAYQYSTIQKHIMYYFSGFRLKSSVKTLLMKLRKYRKVKKKKVPGILQCS